MANKKVKVELPEPGFLEQANALIDESYKISDSLEDPEFKHGFLPRDHKLLVSVMDLHENYINTKVIDKFVAKISEHYEPIMLAIERIEVQQNSIIDDMRLIKSDTTEIKTQLLRHEERITKLEVVVDLPKGFDKRITKLEIYASIKWTIIRWAVAVIIAVLLGVSLFLLHENSMLTTENKVDNWSLYEEQLNNYSGTTRGAVGILKDSVNGKK